MAWWIIRQALAKRRRRVAAPLCNSFTSHEHGNPVRFRNIWIRLVLPDGVRDAIDGIIAPGRNVNPADAG